MKQVIKEELVTALKEKGDVKLPFNIHHPVERVLIEVLKNHHPDVDFESLTGERRKSEVISGEEPTEKIIGFAGEGWTNIKKYAEIERLDFFLPGYTYEHTNAKSGITSEFEPKWSKGYEHPTLHSVIHWRRYHKIGITYQLIGEIIEKHLAA